MFKKIKINRNIESQSLQYISNWHPSIMIAYCPSPKNLSESTFLGVVDVEIEISLQHP